MNYSKGFWSVLSVNAYTSLQQEENKMTNRSLTCNESYANELNEICTSELFDKEVCIHNFEEQWPRRIALGVWGMVVLVFGGFGNLFTIVSLPYAARKQRQVT